MNTGTLIAVDGTETEVIAKKKSGFSLDELQQFVGGYIEVVDLPDRKRMYLNEEGKLNRLPLNRKATELARGTIMADDVIVGPVLITKR